MCRTQSVRLTIIIERAGAAAPEDHETGCGEEAVIFDVESLEDRIAELELAKVFYRR